MNAIQQIIKTLSIEDKRAFISYLNNNNKRNDTLNISLFKMLETDDINDKIISKKFKSADAYHALRKRLFDSLIAFIGKTRYETDTSAERRIAQLLLAARTLFEHKLYKEGFKCLAKAESKAIAIENFSLINEIYATCIQFAHFGPPETLDIVVEKFNANSRDMQKEEQMNIAYALLRRELAEIYHKGKVIDLSSFIKNTLKQLGISADAISFKSLYQLLFIANEYASINSNFKLVEPFMESAYAFIISKESLGGKQLYYHIYILYLLANMHFRNSRFSESRSFLKKMEYQMEKQDRKYYGRFMLRYSLLLALNDNYSGFSETGIEILNKIVANPIDSDETDINDMRLCLVVFYLQQANGVEAMKHILKFNRTDSWYEKKMGMDWAIKKKLVEVLLYLQVNYIEYALLRLSGFKKRYKKYLIQVNENRVIDYATLLETYIKKPEIIKLPAFRNDIENLIKDSIENGGDLFVLSFLGWLKARAFNQAPYQIIIELTG